MDDETQHRLEQRATRGDGRGAAHVLGAARAQADRPSPQRFGAIGVGAIALALATVAGAVTLSRGDDTTSVAAPATTATEPVDPVPVIAQSEASLVIFDSCASVLAELKADALERVGPYGLPGKYGPPTSQSRRPAPRRMNAPFIVPTSSTTSPFRGLT